MAMESSSLLENFGAVNGFYMKTVKSYPTSSTATCVESVEVTPTRAVGQISVSVFRWKMMLSSKNSTPDSASLGCQACGKNGETIFTFLERRIRSAPVKVPLPTTRVIDVWIPAERKSIGWIKLKNESPASPLTIMDYNSQMVLFMDKVEEHSIMTISDITGAKVATLQPKKGMRKRTSGIIQWTDWKIKYASPFSEILPTSTKIITLTAFILNINLYSISEPTIHHF